MNHSENHSHGAALQIRPTAVVLVMMLVALGAIAAPVYDAVSEINSTVPERAGPVWIFVSSFMLVYLGGILAHEAGHVLPALSAGGHLKKVIIGFAVAVAIETPGERTNAQQVRISFGGPAAHLLLGVTAGAVAWQLLPGGTGLLVGAVLVFADGLINLLLPVGRNSDAAKLYRSLWHCARGRANQAFVFPR